MSLKAFPPPQPQFNPEEIHIYPATKGELNQNITLIRCPDLTSEPEAIPFKRGTELTILEGTSKPCGWQVGSVIRIFIGIKAHVPDTAKNDKLNEERIMRRYGGKRALPFPPECVNLILNKKEP